MSDFLSNFNKDSYKETKEKKQQTKQEERLQKQEPLPRNLVDKPAETFVEPDNDFQAADEIIPTMSRSQVDSETQIDPTYHQKRKKKFILIGISVIILLGVVYFTYYQMTHVKVPDFSGEDLAEARTWATENKVKINVEQKYDKNVETNKVITQKSKKGSKIKKGSELKVTASLGADPEEKLTLPDFMTMKKSEAEQWIKKNHTDNISLIDEYNETLEKGKSIRFEIVNKEVKKENYKRKDKANMYYSKGKETFEKNISVPDFTKKTKAEVESWAKTNEIKVTYEEASSAEIPAESIISQSIAKDQKIAKKDSMTVTVSLGKGYVVPNFSEYTQEEAGSAVEGLTVKAKTIFTANVPYGQLISQSVEAGTTLTSKDDLKVDVYYSAGQPYLKDLRNNTVEGDLQKYFYEEFQSKGANIRYTVRYVDSAEPKGTVVGMSAYNQYVPLEYTVGLDISLGNLAGAATPKANNSSGGADSEPDEEKEER
ncbi:MULTISPECIES: PASTA domain-containing protein [unclassified Enterococcus]|uniref:PASTA domain-containing protein n=1 Tax=unclassified Enterococcus TaxID=2608891 RepID=UPI001CE15B41|nr:MULTISPECIES: PASTA domain-containing protein [unclassified Enterococcus]MCA5012246.1 PASTA domain-containing protein [Enterococcus sp. S23]MCA5015497.1 PASTA domain-containing protein [Enterococcus sp. S22(2020)]